MKHVREEIVNTKPENVKKFVAHAHALEQLFSRWEVFGDDHSHSDVVSVTHKRSHKRKHAPTE